MPASSSSWIVKREEGTDDHLSFATDRLVEIETFHLHILCTCPSAVANEMQRLFALVVAFHVVLECVRLSAHLIKANLFVVFSLFLPILQRCMFTVDVLRRGSGCSPSHDQRASIIQQS